MFCRNSSRKACHRRNQRRLLSKQLGPERLEDRVLMTAGPLQCGIESLNEAISAEVQSAEDTRSSETFDLSMSAVNPSSLNQFSRITISNGAGLAFGSTLTENWGSIDDTKPSLTKISISLYVPSCPSCGTPEMRPLLESNVSHKGLLLIRKRKGSSSGSVACGAKE